MNHLKRRSLCKSCRVCFVRDNDTQVYCHSCLCDAHYKSNKLVGKEDPKRKKCLICDHLFFPKHGRNTCSDHCKKEIKKRNEKTYREKEMEREGLKEGLTAEAKRWLQKKERKFIPKYSYSELNRRSEYNRVFGKYSESSLYFKRKGFGK